MQLSALLYILNIEKYMLPCFTKQFLGVDCPGCGLQRSLLFLFKGEFVEAFKMYPAIYPLIALFAFLLVRNRFNFKHESNITFSLMFISTAAVFINFILKFI
ncbi:DUF2752 domain-containing protein [Maribacter flavus]|uniref:DUF2752 domain-containing protein n=2 Tax=Maribacter flavus TaxID=1658664 RepID=A0A5B2TMF8_9FLAO|nr:DUF2752 domain-containing protein [Maribacter flavus]KAA2215374.1 DUF2752 domain-containing protein [Maribacter flavus]